MGMRITHRMMVENSILDMEKNLEKLTKLSKMVSSQKKIDRASDDPSVAGSVLTLRSSLETSTSYLDTAQIASDWMDVTEFAFGQMVEIAERGLQLAISGTSDTVGVDERHIFGTEMDELVSGAIEVANTNHDGDYIFAGFITDTKPFELVPGSPDSVSYSGDHGIIQRTIGPGHYVTVNIDGDTTFSPLFAALISARDALLANDTVALQTAVSDLQSALENIGEIRTTHGARVSQLNTTIERMEDSILSIKSLLSQKEDVNMAEAVSMLRHQETVYEAVLETGVRALNLPTLFDMLS